MNNKKLKPVSRSALRIYLGKKYFTFKRYFFWRFSKIIFASLRQQAELENVFFRHSTPVFRDLKGVDDLMQRNKKVNLELACARLNGIVIRPGETFSYWKLIGRTTAAKGYLPGMFLFYGKVTSRRGGGLCQLSNIIYWTALHTPLTITERYRHSYDVFPDSGRTQPFGSGATCVYNYRDLMIFNGTGDDFQLCVRVEDDMLKAEWNSNAVQTYRYEVYEKDHAITHETWGKYVRHNLIHRRKYDLEGKLVEDEYVSENHALMMYDPFLENRSEQSSS